MSNQTDDSLEDFLAKRDKNDILDVYIVVDKCKEEYKNTIKKLAEKITICYYPLDASFTANMKVKNIRRLFYGNDWVIRISPNSHLTFS